MKLFNLENFNINVNQFGDMIHQYSNFIKHYHRSYSPMTISNDYLVKAHFHQEEGRGGYFAPESGTSEGQFLVIKALMECYEVFKESWYRDLAIELMDSALKILYQNNPLPNEVSEDNLWLPHWLFNSSEEFVAEKYYLYHQATFVNGKTTIVSHTTMRKLFSVRALDSMLEWENPFSKIIGKEYDVSEYSIDGNTMTIQLTEPLNGDAYVIYADLDGPTITHGQCYEAYPIWRELYKGETACAIDSLWWVYDCFKLLAKHTDNSFYERARQYTLDLIVEVMKVSNMNDWHVVDFSSDDPLSGFATYVWQNRIPQANMMRDSEDGSVIINIPSGTGEFKFGRGGIGLQFKSINSIEVKISSTLTNLVRLIIAPVAGASDDERYIAYIKLQGDGVVRKYKLTQKDFVRTNNLIWDRFFLLGDSIDEVYHSEHSNVVVKTVENELGREYRRIEVTLGLEGDGTYLGHAQYQPILADHLFDKRSIPPYHLRVLSGDVRLRITDAQGYYWEHSIPITDDFIDFKPDLSEFVLSDYQPVSGTPTDITFPLSAFVFDAKSDAIFEIMYVGELEYIPFGTPINDFVLSVDNETEQKIKLYYTRMLPLEGYDYTPYVAPFTVNTINNRVDTWRGTPYTGYQCPWIWQEVGDPKGVDTVLDFMEEAQNEYFDRVGVDGFFMPVFIWDRWDSREYGEPNTFTWNGPDPNTHWGGFQYRGIETVARTYYNDPTNEKAKRITYRFLNRVEQIWNDTGGYPTTFDDGRIPISDYREPHITALLLRTAIFYYQATNIVEEEQLCLSLIERCCKELITLFNSFETIDRWNTNFINGTWSTTNNEWYMFWGAEILSALALLCKHTKGYFNIQSSNDLMKIPTYPVDYTLSDNVCIKTPIGIQKVELVNVDSQKATPFRVMTENGLKSLKRI